MELKRAISMQRFCKVTAQHLDKLHVIHQKQINFEKI